MGRSQRNVRLGKKSGAKATTPSGMARPGNGVKKTQGRNDPDPVKTGPESVDLTARVIKTNS
jgi:hypothetical protein